MVVVVGGGTSGSQYFKGHTDVFVHSKSPLPTTDYHFYHQHLYVHLLPTTAIYYYYHHLYLLLTTTIYYYYHYHHHYHLYLLLTTIIYY